MGLHLLQVEVLVHVVSALFDINPSMSSHMAPPLWRRCVGVLFEVRLLASVDKASHGWVKRPLWQATSVAQYVL